MKKYQKLADVISEAVGVYESSSDTSVKAALLASLTERVQEFCDTVGYRRRWLRPYIEDFATDKEYYVALLSQAYGYILSVRDGFGDLLPEPNDV